MDENIEAFLELLSDFNKLTKKEPRIWKLTDSRRELWLKWTILKDHRVIPCLESISTLYLVRNRYLNVLESTFIDDHCFDLVFLCIRAGIYRPASCLRGRKEKKKKELMAF